MGRRHNHLAGKKIRIARKKCQRSCFRATGHLGVKGTGAPGAAYRHFQDVTGIRESVEGLNASGYPFRPVFPRYINPARVVGETTSYDASNA